MVDGVNNDPLYNKAMELAKKLDNDDAKKGDGYIEKNIWDDFLGEHNITAGSTVNYRISVENAAKSLKHYAKRAVADAASSKLDEWMGAKTNPNVGKGITVETQTPNPNATSADMEKHDAKIAELEGQAVNIVMLLNKKDEYTSSVLPQFEPSNVSKENIAYILQKEPDFFAKVAEKHGDAALKTIYKILTGKPFNDNKKKEGESLKDALLRELTNEVKDSKVESKYGKQTIGMQKIKEEAKKNAVRAGESSTQKNVDKYQAAAKTLGDNLIKAEKDKDVGNAQRAVCNASKEVIAYIFTREDKETIFDGLTGAQQKDVAKKLGLPQNETPTLGKIAAKAAEIRQGLENTVATENENIGNAQELLVKAEEIFSQFETKADKRAIKRTKDNVYTVTNEDGTFVQVKLDKFGKISQIAFFDPAKLSKQATIVMNKGEAWYNTDMSNNKYEGKVNLDEQTWNKYSSKLQKYVNDHKNAVNSDKAAMQVTVPGSAEANNLCKYQAKAKALGDAMIQAEKDKAVGSAQRNISGASKEELAYLFARNDKETIYDSLTGAQQKVVAEKLGLAKKATFDEIAAKAAEIRQGLEASSVKDVKNRQDSRKLFDKYSSMLAELVNTPGDIDKVVKLQSGNYRIKIKGKKEFIDVVMKNNKVESIGLFGEQGKSADAVLGPDVIRANPDKTKNSEGKDLYELTLTNNGQFQAYKDAVMKIIQRHTA